MKNKSSRKQHKHKQREKRLRKQRNDRRNASPATSESDRDGSDGDRTGPVHHRMDSERLLRAAQRAMAREEAPTVELAQERVAGFTPRHADEVTREALALGGVEAAQELAYQAIEADSVPRALALASKALEFDPQCCDALTLIAIARRSDRDEVIDALEHAAHCGLERLGAERLQDAERGQLSAIVDARPYLRARGQLFRALLRAERRSEALEHARELFALDAGDLARVRDPLLGLLFEFGRLDDARALLEQHRDDDSPTIAWGAVLEAHLRAGPREARPLLERARQLEPDFEHALLEADFPADSDVAATFLDLGKAWITHGRAFDWLAAGAPLSTPKEREALCASFAPPVATLLELGPLEFGADWIDYLSAHGFTDEHVPELLRLLGAVELDEFPEASPRAWASLHAVRVLGQLRAAAAIEPLIAFAHRHHDDDWLDLAPVFALIGPPAIDALARWLRTPAADPIELFTPVASLVRIASESPASRARIVGELAALLLQFDSRSPVLNAFLCDALFELDATAHRPLVAQVLELGHVDSSFFNDPDSLDAWIAAAERE